METQLSQTDHDLLIRLDQRVAGMTAEIRKMSDDSVQRLLTVEVNKLDRKDFEEYRKTFSEELKTAFQTRKEASEEYRKSNDESVGRAWKTIESNGKRLNFLESQRYIFLGIVLASQILIPLVLAHYHVSF